MELTINEDLDWTLGHEEELVQLRTDYEDLEKLNPVDVDRYTTTTGGTVQSVAEHFKSSLNLDIDIEIVTKYVSLLILKMRVLTVNLTNDDLARFTGRPPESPRL